MNVFLYNLDRLDRFLYNFDSLKEPLHFFVCRSAARRHVDRVAHEAEGRQHVEGNRHASEAHQDHVLPVHTCARGPGYSGLADQMVLGADCGSVTEYALRFVQCFKVCSAYFCSV